MEEWLRGLDSNQDNQIQSLVCCQLHHPGAEGSSVAERRAVRTAHETTIKQKRMAGINLASRGSSVAPDGSPNRD